VEVFLGVKYYYFSTLGTVIASGAKQSNVKFLMQIEGWIASSQLALLATPHLRWVQV